MRDPDQVTQICSHLNDRYDDTMAAMRLGMTVVEFKRNLCLSIVLSTLFISFMYLVVCCLAFLFSWVQRDVKHGSKLNPRSREVFAVPLPPHGKIECNLLLNAKT